MHLRLNQQQQRQQQQQPKVQVGQQQSQPSLSLLERQLFFLLFFLSLSPLIVTANSVIIGESASKDTDPLSKQSPATDEQPFGECVNEEA